MPVYTFTRSTPAYLSDGTQVAANVPRFEQGKFGKAVMVEEGTTNLLPTSKTNYKEPAWEKGAGIASVSFIEETFYGFPVCLITAKNDGLTAYTYVRRISSSIPLTLNIGDKYSATFYVKKVNHRYVGFRVFASGGGSQSVLDLDTGQVYANNPEQQISAVYMGNGWWKVIVINPSLTLTAGYIGICLPINSAGAEHTVCIGQSVLLARTMQLEAKPYPTSFTDGTRAAETLTIPTEGVLNPQEGTVECWVYIPTVIPDDYVRVFQINGVVANTYMAFHRIKGRNDWYLISTGDDGVTSGVVIAGSYLPNGWHFISSRITSTKIDLFIDGVLRATLNTPHLPSAYTNFYLGSAGNRYWLNTLFDDLRISNRARSDAEILAAYQSGQPAPIDEWTTLKLNFSYFESIVINSSVSGVGRKLTRQATNISSAMTMTGRATRGKRAHATANAAVSISGTARRLMRTSAAINITLGLIGRLWKAFQRIYFLLSHIEYKPDLFVEEYVIKLEVIGLAISGSTITLKATFPDSAGDLQELENVVVKIYAPGKVLLRTIPATKISTGVYTADYTIPEDKEGQFDYEFSGSLGSRTIVGRSSFDSHWR